MDKRGSLKAIQEIVQIGSRISANEMNEVAELAAAANGSLIGVDGDDDWCGNGRLRFKWPPKKNDQFIAMLDKLVKLRLNFEVLINGIPNPEEIMLHVHRGM